MQEWAPLRATSAGRAVILVDGIVSHRATLRASLIPCTNSSPKSSSRRHGHPASRLDGLDGSRGGRAREFSVWANLFSCSLDWNPLRRALRCAQVASDLDPDPNPNPRRCRLVLEYETKTALVHSDSLTSTTLIWADCGLGGRNQPENRRKHRQT